MVGVYFWNVDIWWYRSYMMYFIVDINFWSLYNVCKILFYVDIYVFLVLFYILLEYRIDSDI